jgi:hypothetical protein
LAEAPAGEPLPDRLPAHVGPQGVRVVLTDEVVVADEPMWCQRTDLGPVVPVPGASRCAASALPGTADRTDGIVSGTGEPEEVPPVVAGITGCTTWWVHDDLLVDGEPVEWWVVDDTVHAVHLSGLACGLAQLTGRWSDRWALETVLVDPARGAELVSDRAWDLGGR